MATGLHPTPGVIPGVLQFGPHLRDQSIDFLCCHAGSLEELGVTLGNTAQVSQVIPSHLLEFLVLRPGVAGKCDPPRRDLSDCVLVSVALVMIMRLLSRVCAWLTAILEDQGSLTSGLPKPGCILLKYLYITTLRRGPLPYRIGPSRECITLKKLAVGVHIGNSDDEFNSARLPLKEVFVWENVRSTS